MESLPNEALINLFMKLPLNEIKRLCQTHPQLRKFCQQDYLWQLKTEEHYGTFDKPTSLTWKQVYSELVSEKLYLIDFWYKLDQEHKSRKLVSWEEFNGLMYLLYLHFRYLVRTKAIEWEREIFKLKIIDDINELDNDWGITTDAHYTDHAYEYSIVDSYNGISDTLPKQGEDEYFLAYLNRISNKNVMHKLKKYIAVLTTPASKPWMVVTYDSPDFIKGVKLGCELYSLDCQQYLVKVTQ